MTASTDPEDPPEASDDLSFFLRDSVPGSLTFLCYPEQTCSRIASFLIRLDRAELSVAVPVNGGLWHRAWV